MSATAILPQDRSAECEFADLSLEVFADPDAGYGLDWAAADELAAAALPDLLDYAAEWDCLAAAAGNPEAECPF